MATKFKNPIKSYFASLENEDNGLALGTLRAAFGLMMFIGMLRFFYYGWIDLLYVKPSFYFSYWGFSWVKPFENASLTYGLFGLTALGALGVCLGYKFRTSATIFFIGFNTIELFDKTNYLNHYYLVSLIALLLLFMPASSRFSLDAFFSKTSNLKTYKWQVEIFKWLFCIVYFYAGLAKIHSDWLLEAQPLKIWLTARSHLPFIGGYLSETWVAFLFSWFGCLYDLSIGFLLYKKSTRALAYFLVITFHFSTWLLFPIGIFPWVMILSTTVFFSDDFHNKVHNAFRKLFRIPTQKQSFILNQSTLKIPRWVFAFFVFQLLLPLRYLVYNGPLFWTEEGYRFGWRVMLIEKMGYARFIVKDAEGRIISEIKNTDYLTENQEKMMSYQPDMILEFAHFLKNVFEKKGIQSPQIYVNAYVTLNGKGSQPFTNPHIDLSQISLLSSTSSWILAYPYEN